MEKMYTWDGLLIEPIKDYFDELENNEMFVYELCTFL